ncbi:calcium homeostasis modulator protein 6-like [Pezoporus wallicus]|uniref:calcium homeostasis modulator protein 6-like n=1 Tax=Pezoporus wallicus TaxID=35540 RepID=UPI00254C85C9|nr:calcium homeostasis modulator protein 6-like [Pezoporus wallicus]XP_061317789.1 calcium homeostasis modulator protein 6-like [Pezoporus flaviventris]
MDTLRRVLDFCIRHQTVLSYSIVSLMTAAIEYIFLAVVFKCPCNSGNMLYGSVFLIVPAFILFLLGYMMNPRMWHLLTGICTPEKSCSCRPWGTCAGCFCVLLQVTARAVVAPLTWLAVALLRARFYECMASGSSLIKNLMCKDKGSECHEMLVKIPCDEKLSEKISSEFLSLQAQSQLIGWFLITAIMAAALIAKCIRRCCSPFSYLQLKFWKAYSKNECELFEAKAKEHASKLSERNVNCFFEATNPAPFQTPSNEDWRKISFLYTFNSQEQHYSMLHEYIDTNRGSNVRLGKEDQNPTGLGFVNETIASQSGF